MTDFAKAVEAKGRVTPDGRLWLYCRIYPNAWRRFWYWALLGVRWEKL